MKLKIFARLSSAAAAALFAAVMNAPAAHAADPQCVAMIQNRIAWDYQGNTAWNPANIERLCNERPGPLNHRGASIA